MNVRLASHLLKRLCRKATSLALDDAVEAGILQQEDVESHGRVLSVYRRNPDTAGPMSPAVAVAVLSRHRRRLWNETRHPLLDARESSFDEDGERHGTRSKESPDSPLSSAERSKQARADDLEMVAAIRAASEPPRASDIAVMLLIAQAVPDNDGALADVLRALGLRQPIVSVHCETRGFERIFLDLLKRGLILPGAVERSDGYQTRYENFRFEPTSAARRRVITFAGSDRSEEGDEWQVANAALSVYPIVGVAESLERLGPKLVQASQLHLACGTLNEEIVRRTIETVLGASPSSCRLDGIEFSRLSLGDLAIAIRPGVTPDMAAASLRRLAEVADDAGDGPDKPSGKGKGRSSDLPSSRRGADPGSGSDIIQPETLSEASAARPAPTIETLSGYGEASDWALQIRDELSLWRSGDLAWTDLSTKVLLSGPPGVGKSLFARALCNTLRIPLLATSVARWLEPSHLGDVLKRTRHAFQEAESLKPCILFVDEFDGIGRRVDITREYADYWNSVVNNLLEMLDGVSRTDGVIVVCATNNPSVIDPALLRSGRIDRHVEVPLPDAEARFAILTHHLGDDVGTVAAGATTVASVEADLRKVLEESLDIRSDDPYRDLVDSAVPARTEVGQP